MNSSRSTRRLELRADVRDASPHPSTGATRRAGARARPRRPRVRNCARLAKVTASWRSDRRRVDAPALSARSRAARTTCARLVAVGVARRLAMPALHLVVGVVTLGFARPVGRDLRGGGACAGRLGEVRLESADDGTRRLEVVGGVAPNLGLAAAPRSIS